MKSCERTVNHRERIANKKKKAFIHQFLMSATNQTWEEMENQRLGGGSFKKKLVDTNYYYFFLSVNNLILEYLGKM